MKKIRLRFRCWNSECKKNYELTLELKGEPKLHVECPYCGTPGIVDLNPYRIDNKVTVLRGEGDIELDTGEIYSFPGEIPTSPPEE